MACSAYGPVTYGPAPVLIWREPRPGQSQRQLVATGTVLGADADRTVVKRVVLTGYPVRVHKRHATVKYVRAKRAAHRRGRQKMRKRQKRVTS
jgi:pre-rRNA-processing protein TSR1